MDFDISKLRREFQEDPTPQAEYRYRMAKVRLGQQEGIGLRRGDIIEITEAGSPWIRGAWIGVVTHVVTYRDIGVTSIIDTNPRRHPNDQAEAHIMPLEIKKRNYRFRVRPSPQYLVPGQFSRYGGLLVTADDIAMATRTVIDIVPPDQVDDFIEAATTQAVEDLRS